MVNPGRRPVIWCDFGGVLTAPTSETLGTFCARVGVDPPTLLSAMKVVAARYGTTDIMEPLDTPMVAESEWSRQVEKVLAEKYRITVDLSDFAAHWFDGRPANTALVDYLVRCRRDGMFVGMLSNMVPAFEPHWSRLVSPEVFDDLVFSCRVGLRKPDRRIYRLAETRAGAQPGACLLIDDLPANCAGALDAGWSALEFRNVDDVSRLRDLVERLSRTNLSPAGSE